MGMNYMPLTRFIYIVWSIIETFLLNRALSCIVNIFCYSIKAYVVIEESE